MKVTVNHPVHGEIVFEENFWTGKKKLSATAKSYKRSAKRRLRERETKRFFSKAIF